MNKVEQVVSFFEEAIKSEKFSHNQKVMSIRDACAFFSFSKNTIVEAYDRLVALGYLKAKPGAGYFVSNSLHRRVQISENHLISQAVDSASLLLEQLNPTLNIRIGDGRPPSSWMSQLDVNTKIKIPLDSKFSYVSPMGYLPLRKTIHQLLLDRGINTNIQQIVTTYGASHAMDLIIKNFLSPGDTVFVESPGYYPLFAKLKLYKIKYIGIDRLKNGPDLQMLEERAKQYRPTLFFTQSLGHNPTGNCTSLGIQHQILKLADRFGFLCVESDPFADLFPSSTPRLATLDQLQNVIYIGTYSKVLSANFRIGYIASNEKHIKSLSNIKMLTIVNSSEYMERWLHSIITNSQYPRHLRKLRSIIDSSTQEAINQFNQLQLNMPFYPEGSYYLWLELGKHINDIKLSHLAAEQSIFLAPGSLFYPDKKGNRTPALRINIANALSPEFIHFLKQHI